MNTFYKITEKIIKRIPNPDLNQNNFGNDNLYNILFSYFSFNENLNNIKKKYHFLKQTHRNIFLSVETKIQIINIFCQSQKTYFALSKLAFYYKWKRSKIVIDTDLWLNQIELEQKNKICLYHQNNLYLFTINDIVNLIISGLTYSTNFFSSALPIRNPYNNIPFTKSNLYNIYFTLFFRCIPIPKIIQQFFQSNFDLDLFEKENDVLIREYIILNYVKNLNESALVLKIQYMIENYNKKHFKKIDIDKSFPNEKLIEVFKPYLYLFYFSIFSLDIYKKVKYGESLERMLFRLRYYFPKFGRKIIQVTSFCTFSNELSGFKPINNIEEKNEYISIKKITDKKRKRTQTKQKHKKRLEKNTQKINVNESNNNSSELYDSINKLNEISLERSFIFLQTLSKNEDPSHFSFFSTNYSPISKVYFNEEYPPFFSDKENKFFLSSHIGLLNTQPIEDLLDIDKFTIPYRELEYDRIPFRKNQENELLDEEDELIDIYVLQN